MGFTFFLEGEKLKYEFIGEGLPDNSAASLFAEAKANREQVIAYLKGRTMSAEQAIKLAWGGKLRYPVLIEPRAEFRELWGGAVWLCPDDASKGKIRQKYPNDFALSVREFFDICQLVKNGGREAAKGVINALRLFGGTLEEVENNGKTA